MRLVGLVLGLSLTGTSAFGQASGPPAPVSFEVSAERLACLRDHASVYRAADRPLLFIPLAACPVLPDTPILASIANQAAGKPIDKSKNGFIYVTRQQFECLVQAKPADAQTYRFFPDDCRLDVVR